jgi:hypothetical protein
VRVWSGREGELLKSEWGGHRDEENGIPVALIDRNKENQHRSA